MKKFREIRSRIGWRLMDIERPYAEHKRIWDWRSFVYGLGSRMYNGFIV